jgi:poly-beta-1,6-N-acetyl-D-glucosamine synthase
VSRPCRPDGVDYAAVTPAHDERDNLRRLADSLAAQTVRPARWVIVENGSTDGTEEIARGLADELPWVSVLAIPRVAAAARGAPIVRAFEAGLATLEARPDVVVKLDADVSLEPEHFERLLEAFASRPRLGIASGTCLDEAEGYDERFVTGEHVWGAVRAYRAACLPDVTPLEAGMGWDTVDEVKARLSGWETAIVPGVAFRHHRLEGRREGSRWNAWCIQGQVTHFLGYRPLYVLAKTAFRASREPTAVGIVVGFADSALHRRPRVSDRRVSEELRRGQRLRDLPRRAREAAGDGRPASLEGG